jgi:predicted metal-binding membrane protein
VGVDDRAVDVHRRDGDAPRVARVVRRQLGRDDGGDDAAFGTSARYEFARRSEGRTRWRGATSVLAGTYLSIWLVFGLACYVVLSVFPVPPADQGRVGGLALIVAGLYGLTPIKAASEARCRQLCSLHGPLPFSLVRSALVAGARYGLSCVGCSAGLMVSMAIIGMSNLAWAVILTGVVLVYKLAPVPRMRRTWLLSMALIAMAVVNASN